MWYIITLCIGVILGFTISSIMSVGSFNEKMQEAYNYGVKAGKRIATETNTKDKT